MGLTLRAFHLQLVAGKGLPVPDYVRGNLSAFSYVFDGEVSFRVIIYYVQSATLSTTNTAVDVMKVSM